MNTQELDQVRAAELRSTYADLAMVAQSKLSSPTYGLVDKFLFNAESADDSTLVELSASTLTGI